MAGVTQLDLIVIDLQKNRSWGLTVKHDVVETGIFQFGGEVAAGICRADTPGDRALSVNAVSRRAWRQRAHQGAGTEDQTVIC